MSENNTNTSFVYGVLDTFQLLATRDIATVGRVKGTIHKGDSICIRNYGDEDDEVVISKIIAIEIEKKPVDEARDCFVMLRIEDGTTENIKPGSVVYSDGTPDEDIRVAYMIALKLLT